jgi:exopolysaccharide biosynthesis protein
VGIPDTLPLTHVRAAHAAILIGLGGWFPALLQATQIVTNPFVGITLITRTETSPRPENMHIVEIDLSAPGISFELTPPGGTLETVRQTTLGFLNQEHAQLAINSHFFLPFPSTDTNAMLIGLAASNGNVYSSFEAPVQSYAIVTNAPALNIDALNRAGIVHDNTNFTDGKHVLENVILWNTVAGSAQIITNGNKTIPTYLDASNPDGLLTPGGPASYSNSNSWYALTNARTVIGLSQDNRTLFLFTVDNAGGSRGMSLGEVADLLVNDYGVYNALNLDGGGSTTMAMQNTATGAGAIINVSSDNPNGRSVGSNLAVFAVAVPEPSSAALVAVVFCLVIMLRRRLRNLRFDI